MNEIRYKNEMKWKDGIQVNCEVKEVINTRNNQIIKSESVICDRAYYEYLEWKDRYANGFITDETLEVILKLDNLKRFVKDGDFVRGVEGVTSEQMDARIESTRKFEREWYGKLGEGKRPWQVVMEMAGNAFKTLEDSTTAVWSKSNSPVLLAGKDGAIPSTAKQKCPA